MLSSVGGGVKKTSISRTTGSSSRSSSSMASSTSALASTSISITPFWVDEAKGSSAFLTSGGWESSSFLLIRVTSSSLDGSGWDDGSGFGMSLGLEDLGAKREGRLTGARFGPSRSSRSMLDVFPAGESVWLESDTGMGGLKRRTWKNWKLEFLKSEDNI